MTSSPVLANEAAESDDPQPILYERPIPEDRLDPDAVKVVRRLNSHGHLAYLVGGGVRDLLLERAPKDFDIATSAKPQEVRRLFRNCRLIGRRFRLAHIMFSGGKVIEVATFRKDPKQPELELDAAEAPDAGEAHDGFVGDEAEPERDLLIRSDNVFGDPHEDAVRRDFTINGLYYDIEEEEVIDYVDGMKDVEARIIRTIGVPEVRFREDPIRMLRAIKFGARLGFELAGDVRKAIELHARDLARSPKPRVFEEILRLMRGGAARASIDLAWDTSALAVILPELSAYLDDRAPGSELVWKRLDVIDEWKREDRLPSDIVLFCALLYGPLLEYFEGADDPRAMFDQFIHPISVRLMVPRRIREAFEWIALAQPRIAERKIDHLRRREWFRDAFHLYLVELAARGEETPDWAVDLHEELAGQVEIRPRRKRRPSRRQRPFVR